MRILNVNEMVKVKLTEKGLDIYWEYNRDMPEQLKPSINELRRRADKEGYHSFQIWKLMNIFGASIGISFDLPFETNMLIDENILNEVGE